MKHPKSIVRLVYQPLSTLGAIALFLTSAMISVMTTPTAIAQLGRDRPDFFEQGQRQFESEIQRLEQQQPDTTPVLTVETAEAQWAPVVMREANFVAWMPQGSLTQNQRTIATPIGDLEFESIGSHSSLGRFVVGFSEPLDQAPDDPAAALDWVQDYISRNQTGFSLNDTQNITFNTYLGKDFSLTNEEETIFFRLLSVDKRLYVLALSQPTEQTSVETKSAFFNSFQLL